MAIPRSDAAHLLRRTGFGGTGAQIDALAASADWPAAVERVLDTTASPAVVPPPSLRDPDSGDYTRWVDSVQWWIERMRTSPTPLVEKLALFWHNHFVSGTDKVGAAPMFDQVDLYRRLGLGDFHTLVQAMAVHPAMLVYLDNATNVAGAENENFAREVMELFTMGNFTFSEADVIANARAWTGHGLDDAGLRYEFHAADHDAGSKTIFGLTSTWDGPAVLTEIVRGSKQQVCARFVAAKLWSFFAAPNPDAALVAALGDAFVASGMNVKALLRAIFLRPEFLAPATRGALVRSPVEWMVAVLRALGVPAADAHPEWFLEAMGQKLFEPPNVSGWKQNGYWISTSAQWAKADYVTWLRWVVTDDSGKFKLFAGLDEQTPDQILAAVVARFGLEEASPATLAVIRAWAAGLKGNWDVQWSIRPNVVPLATLSPDFQLA